MYLGYVKKIVVGVSLLLASFFFLGNAIANLIFLFGIFLIGLPGTLLVLFTPISKVFLNLHFGWILWVWLVLDIINLISHLIPTPIEITAAGLSGGLSTLGMLKFFLSYVKIFTLVFFFPEALSYIFKK